MHHFIRKLYINLILKQSNFFITNKMDSYEYQKYVTTKEKLKETIDMYGVAIIPGVLNDEECDNMLDGIWNYFEHITQHSMKPICREDSSTWGEIYKLFPLHSMLFQHFQVGQSQVCWDQRQHPKIVDIFQTFWKTEDLVVSFDGLSFNIPPEKTNRGWYRGNTWYHTDQSFTRPDFECIQSWVTALDVNKGDATLAFMEGSNKYHKEFADALGVTDKGDWFKLKTKEHKEFYENKGCSYKKIYCPKGSIVFWDSRTIHCGCEALRTRIEKNFRAIIYLCYTPKSLLTTRYEKKKQKAFNEIRTTSHWPHKPKLFGKTPHTYGNKLPIITSIDPPILSELGMKLAGF